MVRTLCFQRRGHGFDPQSVRELRSHMPHGVAKKKKKSEPEVKRLAPHHPGSHYMGMGHPMLSAKLVTAAHESTTQQLSAKLVTAAHESTTYGGGQWAASDAAFVKGGTHCGRRNGLGDSPWPFHPTG